MSVLDKFLNVMRLNPDDDDDFYNEDYDYDDDYEEDEPVKPKSSFRKDKKKAEEDDYEEDHSIHEKAVKSSPKKRILSDLTAAHLPCQSVHTFRVDGKEGQTHIYQNHKHKIHHQVHLIDVERDPVIDL